MSVDLSLDRVSALSKKLPKYTRPTFHVAGTNGKGSVTCLLSSILRASDLTVGRFNSPHLVSIYDCILINDEPVSQQAYQTARQTVEAANQAIGASSFELLTLTALLLFENAKLDVVVVEVGMGGRLDATNVIPDDCIIASALTAVDLDHQQFLGNSVELIAQEKAGIARKGKPFVMGIQKHTGVEAVVKESVSSAGGYFVHMHAAEKRDWDSAMDDIKALLPLYGSHQIDNLGLTLSIISTITTTPLNKDAPFADLITHITPESIRRGIRTAMWPGRLSFHRLILSSRSNPLTVLADGAHNRASSETLATYVSEILSNITPCQESSQSRTVHLSFILALSHSPPKTPLETLSPLLPPRVPPGIIVKLRIAAVRFTSPDGMPWVKSVPPSELTQTVKSLVPEVDVWYAPDESDPGRNQLESALAWTGAAKSDANEEELVVVAGSLYLVADFYRFMLHE
ncbi:Mur ligase [Hygrophoropsis aurantiaca]|uniref:Mur ligase n=1 Tax=Hygrophoropsis aurantiaca TaxID=72124 RepID=A0ACB8ANH1_9AGAM|nr:Mur ligase [Hygrophoropsis aurantiaca]